jgi:hypothetical protein
MMARPTVLPMMTVDVDGKFGDAFSDGIEGISFVAQPVCRLARLVRGLAAVVQTVF